MGTDHHSYKTRGSRYLTYSVTAISRGLSAVSKQGQNVLLYSPASLNADSIYLLSNLPLERDNLYSEYLATKGDPDLRSDTVAQKFFCGQSEYTSYFPFNVRHYMSLMT